MKCPRFNFATPVWPVEGDMAVFVFKLTLKMLRQNEGLHNLPIYHFLYHYKQQDHKTGKYVPYSLREVRGFFLNSPY